MAEAVATLSVNPYPKGLDQTQLRAVIYGTCSLSAGGTYATNGIPLNWTGVTVSGTPALQDGNFNNTAPFLGNWGPLQTQPQDAWFYSSTAASGYSYVYDTVHNTLRIFSGGTELANAAAITADTIHFCAEFLKNAF